MYNLWYKVKANYGKEFTSKCNFGMLTSSPSKDVMHSWTGYGQDSKPQWCRVFLENVAWAICSTYHTVLKASLGAAIFGRDMLFNIPFIANWNKIWDYRQCQTDLNLACENSNQANYDYKVGDKVLLTEEGILRKAESPYSKKPWTITTIIQMELSGFITKKWKDLLSGE